LNDDWTDYKKLILKRLDDLEEVEKEVRNLKISLATMRAQAALIAAGVVIVLSHFVPMIFGG